MSFSYTIKESFSGFTRTKLSAFISIITIGISLLLLGIFAVISINTSRFIELLRSRVELEAFLQEPLTQEQIGQLVNRVLVLDGVDSLIYISKEDAAHVFKEEFGEDITKVLDFNPLPPSFKIFVKPEYQTAAGVAKVHNELMAIKGIDQIIYRRELLELIDQRTGTVNNITLGLGLLISFSSILLVSNTIRLAIYAKRKIIRTMGLVGATSTFIRLPFLIEGGIQGTVGGLLASGLLYATLEYAVPLVAREFSAYLHMPSSFYALVVLAGLALGLVGAVISIVRFIRVS
jgi:cell division transport system permease protein